MFDKLVPSRRRMDPRRPSAAPRRLDRRNAVKNIDYDAASTSWASSDPNSTPALSPSNFRASRSLDLSPSDFKTSFRIGGVVEGEVDQLCRSLGLSGPEDFAIPAADWALLKARSSPAPSPQASLADPPDFDQIRTDRRSPVGVGSRLGSHLLSPNSVAVSHPDLADTCRHSPDIDVRDDVIRAELRSPTSVIAQRPDLLDAGARVRDDGVRSRGTRLEVRDSDQVSGNGVRSPAGSLRSPAGAGIRGVRPPVLSPPVSGRSVRSPLSAGAGERGMRDVLPSAVSPPDVTRARDSGDVIGSNVRSSDTSRIWDRGDAVGSDFRSPVAAGEGDRGIRGARPSVLSPPDVSRLVVGDRDVTTGSGLRLPNLGMSAASPPPGLLPLPPVSHRYLDKTSSAWDIVRSFAPEDEEVGGELQRRVECEAEVEAVLAVALAETVEDHTGSGTFSSDNEDDSSSTTTEPAHVISPNGKFTRIINSWEKGGLLGSGSFGTVYEGISHDGIFFAVKEVSLLDQGANAKQCISQLEQEIALLSQFEHENIVQYYGTDKEEAKLFIFLELVTQGSLASLYQKYHLRDSQVSAYTRQILSGLKYLHDRSIVHRDIKCTNILVHANGSVKLADFGLAKEITKLNMLKSCKGSVYWMAPEVVQSKKTYGPSADIWSLGCTVLEMLTRQVPYPDLEWAQAFFKIGRGEKPVIPDSLSEDARNFISECIQVNPDDRPSAAKLLEHSFVRRSLPVSDSSDGSSHGSSHGNRRWS